MRYFLALGALLTIACGDSGSGSGGSGGADDGKFHPTSDGSPVDEAPACESMRDQLTTVALDLGCVSTFETCPGFVRSVGGAECLQYDGGTIDGCVAYFGEAADCDDIKARAESCAFEAIADSAPGGCPE